MTSPIRGLKVTGHVGVLVPPEIDGVPLISFPPIAPAATLRVRPLVMTVGMNIVGLIPVMVDTGVESDVAKRVAAPLWGGLISLTILTLAVIPAFYVIWRGFQLRRVVPGGQPVDAKVIREGAS